MEMPTPDVAYDVLAKLNIAYERLDHAPITSVRDTDIVLPGLQVKNLCLKTKKGKQYFLVILRDEKSADLKRLAEALSVSRLSFVGDEELTALLAVEAGAVTPFGVLFDADNKVQVVIDAEVDETQTVGFHPFINTTTLNIAYADFVRFLEYAKHPPLRVMC